MQTNIPSYKFMRNLLFGGLILGIVILASSIIYVARFTADKDIHKNTTVALIYIEELHGDILL